MPILRLMTLFLLMPSELSSLTLKQWLDHISAVHPREMELGLSRIKSVAGRLELSGGRSKIITIAGTNGKGTCVSCLESLLEAAGFSTGAYTSPHLHSFNERIRLNGENVSDDSICDAFSEIEQARAEVSLSYFEFATLAALLIYFRAEPDFILLEVGLGGRLDAVNMVDPDMALITSISLDHQDWLGSDLEGIGFEKAGIMRPGVATVFADDWMPDSIANRAKELASPLYRLGRDFDYHREHDPISSEFRFSSRLALAGEGEPAFSFEAPVQLHRGSVAACLQVLQLFHIELEPEQISKALQDSQLPGRFERRIHCESGCQLILDVAHNPAAAQLLDQRLENLMSSHPQQGRIIAVLAVLDDKDIEGIVVSLQSRVDIWYIAQIEDQRGLSVNDAMERLKRAFPGLSFEPFETVEKACLAACGNADSNDWVVVAGSFHTVAIAREHSRAA